MKNKRIKIFLCAVVILVLLVTCGYIDNNTFKIRIYNEDNVSFSDLKGTTMVQISDLHNQEYGKNNINLINKILDINPDYVFMTGDMVNAEDKEFNGFYSLVNGLSDKFKCFYVVGNHELGLGEKRYNEMMNYLKEHGVIVLDNIAYQIKDDVFVYGLNYASKYYLNKKYTKKDMDKDLGVSNDDAYNILLAHNPNDFDTYSEWGADMVFSGHTHGGMIKIFGIGLISPSRNLFPEYDGGEYELNNSTMINSAGMSKGHIGFRLFNQPELVVIYF